VEQLDAALVAELEQQAGGVGLDVAARRRADRLGQRRDPARIAAAAERVGDVEPRDLGALGGQRLGQGGQRLGVAGARQRGGGDALDPRRRRRPAPRPARCERRRPGPGSPATPPR
jgi:hypothetical protein